MIELSPERLFGRRKGRPLRQRRVRLMEELLPTIEITVPATGKVIPESFFPSSMRDIWMEIGFGGGEHLAAQAVVHPEVGFLGCEPFINGVASLLAHIDTQKLNNIRIYPDDARHILDALPEASLGRCFVLFADPWPKKRHADRRFIGKENLDRLARTLKPDGEMHLATDVESLALWMRERVEEHPSFVCLYDSTTPPVDWVPTRYEQKGCAAGRQSTYMIYRRA
ncbi:MAG TPA: tRNA (guanosine(46)-N7)-methyltransferase TrmB [Rhodospirillaceae bacterium]|nr:tRNA (guanosine(46)-N7)-methyltransferase TrmB [Rhodospirillaceae bacterium]